MNNVTEPSLQEVRYFRLLLQMVKIDIPLEICDQILRTQKAYKKMKGKFDLHTAAKIIYEVQQRWKDGVPEVVWNCEGFRGYKK
ncbi:MAG TPA: hypothetical protein VFO76_09950 [Candidatus Kapabacteria bacterium]|nr:hypothetical protein [Candidatus Kapabacteria bacterium]